MSAMIEQVTGPRESRARELIRRFGARLTVARVRVLAELLDAESALTHIELQKRVEAGAEPIDRVTLYRVLEWLEETGVVHRVAGPDRVFHFAARQVRRPHGHFRCVQCARMYCIEEPGTLARSVRALLPTGFSGEEIEVTVSGRCARCASP
ncbi:MAG: transcriptional repressor [Burkholderiaceae bacterium]|nr:transcriptional repressor [Burkholderiaceae bacterium]